MVPPAGWPSVIATVLPEMRPVVTLVGDAFVMKSYWAFEPGARSRYVCVSDETLPAK